MYSCILVYLINFICHVLCFIFGFFKGSKKRKIIISSDRNDGWLDIKKYPIPLDQKQTFIVTDGKTIDTQFFIYFNEKGNVCMGYNKNSVTHWMPFPNLPDKTDIE